MQRADVTALLRSRPIGTRHTIGRIDWAIRAGLLLLALFLVLAVLLPLAAMLSKSLEGPDNGFVGFSNFRQYFADGALGLVIEHSLFVSIIVATITLAVAFLYAYALQRSCMRWRGFFRAVALVPLLAPSLLPGLGLVYLLGNQGLLHGLMMGHTVYGPIGIVTGEVFFTLPHATMIILAALSAADQRLYDAAESLRAGRLRVFIAVTLPGCRYGVISAGMVAFVLAFTDFGVPKVIGGSYDVLATDVYKQVIGQFNFGLGAVVGVLLLVPAILAFAIDRMIHGRQISALSGRAMPYRPKPNPLRDKLLFVFCTAVAVLILGILVMAAMASIVTYWPYNLTPTLANYAFANFDPEGWQSYANSLEMATLTALIGTSFVFGGAYLLERTHGWKKLRSAVQLLCMLPLAVPGLVLGLSYVLFFNAQQNPMNFLYLTMAILVLSTIIHFYTVCHVTAVTALKQLDPEFESVGLSLKAPLRRVFLQVTVRSACQRFSTSLSTFLSTR
jgi:iron(III) transport system permease protein